MFYQDVIKKITDISSVKCISIIIIFITTVYFIIILF